MELDSSIDYLPLRQNDNQGLDATLWGLFMKSEKEAATLIQKTLRGIAARAHLVIKKLPDTKLCSYRSFLIGNDTPLTTKDLEPHKINTNFVLIGTSLFRSADIACKLAASESVFPKVIIVDNSREAAAAWAKIKQFFHDSTQTSWKSFLFDEDGFLEFVFSELNDIRIEANLIDFFKLFARTHTLEYVKRVGAGVVMIQQDWSDIETFRALRQMYKDRPIVTYSSNIIPYVVPSVQINVIKCIDTLKPCLSLCTNLDSKARCPTISYVLLDSSPASIVDTLHLDPVVADAFSMKDKDIDPEESPGIAGAGSGCGGP